MTKDQVIDSVFDAFFKQAVIDNFFEEFNLITEDDEISSQCIFSDEHNNRMISLFVKEKRKNSFNIAIRWGKHIAAAVFISISILFGSLMLVPEVRAIVIDTVVEWFDQFARFNSNSSEIAKSFNEPTFIPEGFREEFRDGNDMITIILYADNNDVVIFFETHLTSTQLSIDNEDHYYKTIQVDGIDFHILTAIKNYKENKIIWEKSGQRYILSSEISVDELLKMAFSVD
ncbi:MAG: DUF4367 domain-containing protein [Oscillospiraceae bacterium]|jgi:hypothetical protein|nr:DUF4367 domain-containing protein [Oscillospiraceae bacterium]